jgi:ankyrin repeat protein
MNNLIKIINNNKINNNKLSLCKLLIEKGTDLNLRDNEDNTPLMYATYQNNLDICELLIEKGADLNLKNTEGTTSLMISILENNSNISKLLIEKGADLNLTDNEDNTSLMLSIEKNNFDICKLLIEKGADLNLKNNKGYTSLMLAVVENNFNICKLLIEKDVDLNLKNNDGYTSLMISIKNNSFFAYYNNIKNKKIYFLNNLYIIKLLIKKGADLNIENNKKLTPLFFCIKFNNLGMFKFLIKNNVDINFQNSYGLTPLMFCIINNYDNDDYNIDYIKILIENNANIFIKDKKEKTAFGHYNYFYSITNNKNNYIEENKEIINLINTENDDQYIKKYIKNMIDKKIFDTTNINKFFYIMKGFYNICSQGNYSTINKITIEKNKELNVFKNLNNQSKLLKTPIRIQYKNSYGINYGGLSKEFYNDIEKNINLEYLEEKIKKENNKQEINKLSSKINILKKYDIINILKILAISKINCNPIYYKNNYIKNMILNEIKELYDTNIEKNFIYNILDYISIENEKECMINNKNIFLSKNNKSKIQNYLVNENIYNKSSIKSIKKRYLEENNELTQKIKKRKININNNKLFKRKDEIIDLINNFIKNKIYENFYDFFLSHFILEKITINSLLKNLKFKYIASNSTINKNEIENKFKKLFKSFNENELYLFNKAISGKSLSMSKKTYIINIFNYNTKNPIVFHTCFNTMDFCLSEYNLKYFDNKKDFVNVLEIALINKFSTA